MRTGHVSINGFSQPVGRVHTTYGQLVVRCDEGADSLVLIRPVGSATFVVLTPYRLTTHGIVLDSVDFTKTPKEHAEMERAEAERNDGLDYAARHAKDERTLRGIEERADELLKKQFKKSQPDSLVT